MCDLSDVTPEVRWERMFPHQLNAAFAACPSVYFAYGLCEPHGPHNAIGLDALKAYGICVRAAQEHGGIVAPPDYWHVHELCGYALWAERSVQNAKPWMSAVPPWVHFKNVCYHVRAAEVLDFRSAILITGHYGPNWEDLKTLVEKIQPHCRMRIYGLGDFEANVPGFSENGPGGDLAGKVETSLLWALEPGCVDPRRLPEQGHVEYEKRPMAMGSDAAESDLEVGKRMVADEVAWLGAKHAELRAAFDPNAPSRLRTFDDVENFWKDEIAPIIRTFESYTTSWVQHRRGEVPAEGSRWYENHSVRPWTG